MPVMLLIDDHPATVMLIRSILPPEAAWQVLTAPDGLHALTLISEQRDQLDIIVLDIYLPGLDGRRVYTYIQALAPTVPVIGISSDSDALTELAARGCFAVIPKPIRRADLLAMLDRALAIHRDVPLAHLPPTATHGAFDRQLVPQAQLQDLNLQLVEQHLITAMARRDYDGPTDPIAFLREQGGAVSVHGAMVPTYAGLLMFADDPVPWIPGCGVDVALFTSDTPTIETMGFRQTMTGPMVPVITRTLDLLWALIPHRTRLLDDVERVESHAYPRLVLRELTVNALCHRDWSLTGASVQIRVFPDHIEWITPGGLPTGVTVETLREAQHARNSTLAKFLYQAGAIERFGLGMDMVYQALASHGMVPPSATNAAGWFRMTIFRAQDVDISARPLAVAHSRATVLTSRQEQVLHVVRDHGTLLAHDIADLLHTSRRSIQRDLNTLVHEGRLDAIGATRSRRYRWVPPATPSKDAS